MRVLAPLAVVCLFAVAQAASLQSVTIRGTVVDSAGGALPGAKVELLRAQVVERTTTTTSTGAWTFENVVPGSYQVRAVLSGFATAILPVRVGPGGMSDLRITMKAGTLSEVVILSESKGATQGRAAADAVVVAGSPPPAVVEHLSAPVAPPFRGDTATYASIVDNRFRSVSEHPLSTFSVDVDTASYSNVRRFLNQGRLPPADAVRIEEMINYFKYDYPDPRGDAPLSITTEYAVTPWNPKTRLALIGMRAAPIRQERTPPRNLTFLLDVSGSMTPQNRLPLVKTAMQMLVDTLRDEDTVAIVVYAGNSGLVLRPTSGGRKAEIRRAIEHLNAGGSTNGAAGIQLAYDLASENFVKDGINRVILATDGDFNVGVTSRDELTRMIEQKRERGIFLSVLGVGDDNLQDATMEMLADKGNGNYSYLDSVQEARRVLIAEAGSTLVTVAKDVKAQIEFNPRLVAAYRLIGYENRILRKEDFKNDRKDAGDVGAGHAVTVLYEIVPAGESVPGSEVDPLKYQPAAKPVAAASGANASELMNVKVRYKAPHGDVSSLLEVPVSSAAPRMSRNVGFAAGVAAFGMLLRNSEFKGTATWDDVLSLLREHRGDDRDGYRAELSRLVDVAAALHGRPSTSPDLRR